MLLRYDPFRQMERLADTSRPAAAVPMDASRQGEQVVVQFDLPGVDPASIDVEVEKNVLTVAAERRRPEVEGEKVLASERRHGTFRRQVRLGDALDGGRVEARYADGVLALTIPVAEAAKPHKVEVALTAAAADAVAS